MKNNKINYYQIINFYENCLDKYGDTSKGIGWKNEKDLNTRYAIMLDLIKELNLSKTISLLDFGCGTSNFYKYIIDNNYKNIKYSGLDISSKFVSFSKNKYPLNNFYCLDILASPNDIPNFDYIIMNGVFTQKRELSFDEMWKYTKKIIRKVYNKSNKGIAFNFMSKYVDWEKEGNFYVPFDLLARFIKKYISSNFVFRQDYGLYEYTTYVYK